MKKETGRVRRALAVVLYLSGLLLMVVVAGIVILPAMELSFFDRPLVTEETLSTLRCPPAVTPHEDGVLTGTFTNDQDRDVRFRVRARISFYSAAVFDEVDRWVELAPGETEIVRWPLETESAAFGRMILARVHVPRRGSIPSQQRGCGVMVLNLPLFTGSQYVYGMAVGGLLAVAASGFLWLDGRRPVQWWREKATRRLALVAAVIAGAMFASLWHLWVVGGLLLLFSVLLVLSFSES